MGTLVFTVWIFVAIVNLTFFAIAEQFCQQNCLQICMMDSGALVALRHCQAVPNKKGRIPILEGTIFRDTPVTIHRIPQPNPLVGILSINDNAAVDRLLTEGHGVLNTPYYQTSPIAHPMLSRFLAKVGMEAFALRGLDHGYSTDYLVHHPELDECRNHARYGQTPNWPYAMRRIYDIDFTRLDHEGNPKCA